MRKYSGMICIVMAAFLPFAASCSKDARHRDAIVGTWEWTGDSCNARGACAKDIFTDEGSRMKFSADGIVIKDRGRMKFRIEKNRIRLSLRKDLYPEELGEIISIEGDVMLLRADGVIRRYGRVR